VTSNPMQLPREPVDIDRSHRRRRSAPALTSALYPRFASRDLDAFADRALSAMRKGLQWSRREEV